MSKHKVGRLLV